MLLGRLRAHRSRSAQITYRRDNRHDIKALNPPDIKQLMKTGNNIRHHHQRCCVPTLPSWERTTHPAQVKGQSELLQTHLLVPERCKAREATAPTPQEQRRRSLEAAGVDDFRGKTYRTLPLAATLGRCEAAFTASDVDEEEFSPLMPLKVAKSLLEESKSHKTDDPDDPAAPPGFRRCC